MAYGSQGHFCNFSLQCLLCLLTRTLPMLLYFLQIHLVLYRNKLIPRLSRVWVIIIIMVIMIICWRSGLRMVSWLVMLDVIWLEQIVTWMHEDAWRISFITLQVNWMTFLQLFGRLLRMHTCNHQWTIFHGQLPLALVLSTKPTIHNSNSDYT